jgi:putative tricarboxylic transport membrane protein
VKVVKVDFYFSMLLIAIGAVICVVANSYPATPGGFPFWIGAILIGLSALLLLQSILNKSDENKIHVSKTTFLHIFIAAAIIAAYILLLPVLGYIVSSLSLVLAIAVILGYRSFIYLALTPLAAVIFCWVVFQYMLNVPLPNFGF